MGFLGLFTLAAAAQSLGSFISPGELAEAHAELDTLGGCLQCHEPGAGVSATYCMDCHESVRGQVNNGSGFHATLGESCESCHSDHKGLDFQLVQMEASTFQHYKTGFNLEGEHADLECGDCHEDESHWTGLRSSCLPCHAEDELHDQDGSGRELLADCVSCHEINPDWAALPLPAELFDHGDLDQVDYALEGKHSEAECEDCHEDFHFVPVEAGECEDCHDDPHTSGWEAECEDCHEGPQSWEVDDFDHDLTDFSLRGLHKRVSCGACHDEDRTEAVPHARCESCHRDPHRGEFKPRDCDSCHQLSQSFSSMDFDHDATDYPLRGEHRELSCDSCHGEGADQSFTNMAFGDCVDCHEGPHGESFEARSCSSCHDEAQKWTVPDFDHALTGYTLEDKHAEAECSSCHGPDTGPELPHASCQDCHADDSPHDETVSADSCESCHNTLSFTDIAFDHASTGFELTPAHQVECADCHGEEHFVEVPTTCSGCHEEDRPEHHFDGECTDCHVAETWSKATLGELGHGVTGFTLDGTHTQLQCADCHDPDLPGQRVGSTCSSCHRSDDPHRNMLGDDCGSCHNETTWYRSSWTHSQTGWPVRGSHRLAACQDCHATGTTGTPRDCQSCHKKDQTPGPIHEPASADFCGDCHRPYGWAVPPYPN